MSRLQPAVPAARSAGVVIVAVVLVLEALALLAAAGWFAFELLTQTPVNFGGAVFTLVLLLIFAAWLLAVSHFFFRGYRWTRSATLVWQLFMLVIGVPTLTGGVVLPGVALIIPAVVALILLFTKPVMAYTQRLTNSSAAL